MLKNYVEHLTNTKVYFMDGDGGGVVHYSNYLRYMEIGRIDMLDDHGIDLYELGSRGYFFAITKLDIVYRAAAKPGDTIEIATSVTDLKRASIHFRQRMSRDKQLLVEAFITMVLLKDNRPTKLPHELNRLPALSQEERVSV
jgi:acyl-CoA thioester hydrolase